MYEEKPNEAFKLKDVPISSLVGGVRVTSTTTIPTRDDSVKNEDNGHQIVVIDHNQSDVETQPMLTWFNAIYLILILIFVSAVWFGLRRK